MSEWVFDLILYTMWAVCLIVGVGFLGAYFVAWVLDILDRR